MVRLTGWKGGFCPLAQKKKAGYARRWKYAVFPCGLLCFMYCLWGAMEVYVGNAGNFRFTYLEALLPLLAITLAATAALAALAALLRKKAFNLAISLVLALAVCSYVQNALLNLNLGMLSTEDIDWSRYTAHGWKNLALWGGLLALIVTVLMLLKKRTRRVVRLVSAALLAVHVITFGIVSAQHLTSDANRAGQAEYVLSGEKQFQVSAEGNVIVLLLDYFSNDYIDAGLREYPDMLAPLKDFTYYDNADPAYIGTFPSVVHMLTGNPFDTTVPIEKWFKNSWEGENAKMFYAALAEKGYKFNFFDSTNDCFGLQYAEAYINNLVKLERGDFSVRYERLIPSLLQLSAFRYVPHAAKRALMPTSLQFYMAVPLNSKEVPVCYNRNAFYNVLHAYGLEKVQGDGKYFIIEFLRGTHPPYDVNENAEPDTKATLAQCAAGYMKIVGEYLQKLKDAGLYDSSTIILTSDHGDKENSMQVMYFIKEAGVTRKAMAVSSAPISHKDFLGTVLKNIGVESGLTSIYDFKDGDLRERTVMRNYIDTSYPYVRKYRSTMLGTHTAMYAYTYTGDRKDLRRQFRRGPTEILPLTESFN